jgi:hypothetical protein
MWKHNGLELFLASHMFVYALLSHDRIFVCVNANYEILSPHCELNVHKAKLFQEATFFIIIFAYLKYTYRSKMAMEYSAG